MENNAFVIKQADGTEVRLRDIQRASLEILEYFDGFCKKHGLKYTLCGGCCIGALRHKGFIPWDDDIDVHMFREDYERLFLLWKKEVHTKDYALRRTTRDDFQDTMLTQISDQRKTFIKSHQIHQAIDQGLKLEIIPLDGAPADDYKRRAQLFWALLFYLFNRGFAPENRGKMAHILGKLLLFLIPGQRARSLVWRWAEKRMTRYKIENSDFITELCVTWKYMKLSYPKEIFIGERVEEFEGKLYPVPYLAEDYLTMAFGDFMAYPPVEEQIPKHDSAYIDLNKPYENYNGVYFNI